MKYQPPKEGAYESGLTARVLYDNVASLLESEAKKATTPIVDPKLAQFKKYGIEEEPYGKEWDTDEVRIPLAEFVQSYFFGGIETTLSEFQEKFKERKQNPIKELKEYLNGLGESYVSSPEGMEQLRNLHGSLKERYSTFAEQIKGLESLEGVDEKVLENAKDAFGLLTSPYTLVDHLFQIPEGYESIGSWNVSLGIPQAVRDYLRTEFASYSRGELPDSLVRDFAANRVNLVREVPSLMDSIRKDVADEHSGELETLLEGIDSAENMFAIARLLKKHPKDKPEPKSYAKHRLDGSSYELPPDPFADINSYFEGEPAVDAQDITEEDGIIQKPQILYITSPLPLFIEQIKAGAHPKKESSINYEARVTINCKTREAFIDPDPQS